MFRHGVDVCVALVAAADTDTAAASTTTTTNAAPAAAVALQLQQLLLHCCCCRRRRRHCPFRFPISVSVQSATHPKRVQEMLLVCSTERCSNLRSTWIVLRKCSGSVIDRLASELVWFAGEWPLSSRSLSRAFESLGLKDEVPQQLQQRSDQHKTTSEG